MKKVTIKMTEEQLAKVNKALSEYGVKIVSEEEKENQKVNIEPEEHRYDEPEGPEIIMSNSGGYIFLHKSVFEDANMKDVDSVNMFVNDTDIYITDLNKDEIDWGDVEKVENWGPVGRSFNGDLEIKVSEMFECINPYGDTCTINISDHIINIHYDENKDVEEEVEEEEKEFIVTTDAEGRGTINKKILQAANLCPNEDSAWYFNIFTNDSGTKLYITWKDDNYLDFGGEVCKKIKEYFSNGKTSLRIKLGKSYTKYKVTTKEDLITINLKGGVPEDDDPIFEEEEREFNKQREAEEQEELKKKAEELIYQIFGDVEKIKVMTGLDLSNIIAKVVKSILAGNKVF